MAEVQVERLFVTSLTRALEEHAPEELEVFSQWFDPSGRDTHFHVATVIGAVGYLRRNPAIYEKVINAAGRNASEHAFGDFSPIERRLLGSLPRFGRERLVKHLLHSGLRSIHKDAQLSVKREGENLLAWSDFYSGPVHIAFEVENLNNFVKEIGSKGYSLHPSHPEPFLPPVPGAREIAYLLGPDGEEIEVREKD